MFPSKCSTAWLMGNALPIAIPNFLHWHLPPESCKFLYEKGKNSEHHSIQQGDCNLFVAISSLSLKHYPIYLGFAIMLLTITILSEAFNVIFNVQSLKSCSLVWLAIEILYLSWYILWYYCHKSNISWKPCCGTDNIIWRNQVRWYQCQYQEKSFRELI